MVEQLKIETGPSQMGLRITLRYENQNKCTHFDTNWMF